jgi:hypothetical protein
LSQIADSIGKRVIEEFKNEVALAVAAHTSLVAELEAELSSFATPR